MGHGMGCISIFWRYWRVVLRILLGAVFLYAGIVKASDSRAFATALLPFTFVPGAWTGPLAIGLAWIEIISGALLLAPRVWTAGAAMVGGLSVVFMAVLGWAMANGIVVSCGCFGGDEPPTRAAMAMAMIRDAGILAGAAALLLVRPSATPEPGISR